MQSVNATPAVALFVCSVVAQASGVIDFESINGMTPLDGMQVSDQFEAAFGVSFSLEGGGFPILAQVGPPLTAFFGFGGGADQPAPNQNVGEFFLTDDGTIEGVPAPLLINYTAPVAAASGVILDVDAPEAWTIEAFDDGGVLIGSAFISPSSLNAGDGRAAPWSIVVSAPEIVRLRIRYTGVTGSVGLAFDSFSPATSGAAPCSTDLDGDGQTGSADLALLLGAWGACDAGRASD